MYFHGLYNLQMWPRAALKKHGGRHLAGVNNIEDILNLLSEHGEIQASQRKASRLSLRILDVCKIPFVSDVQQL